MRDKTKVKAKNVWKVAKAIIKNPHLTKTDISQQTGLARNTVIKASQELSTNWTKDPVIKYIVWSSKERIARASQIFDRFLDEVESKKDLNRSDIREVVNIVKDDMAKVNVFGGTLTDDNWGLRYNITDEQKKAIEERLIIDMW